MIATARAKFAAPVVQLAQERERLRLKPATGREIVRLLERYNLSDTSEDVKGIAFERFLGRQTQSLFEKVSLLAGDVVANGRRLDQQPGTAAVTGILCSEISRGQNDRFANLPGIAILILH